MRPWSLALAMLTQLCMMSFAQTPLRVACVGDSITFGQDLPNRKLEAYPLVLSRLAQGRLEVENFGVSGATAMPHTFLPWSETRASFRALDFAPDVVVILLGINDFFNCRDDLLAFPSALRAIGARFRKLPSAPQLFFCTLLPLAPPEEHQEINDFVRATMNPMIRGVASELGAALIDLSATFPSRLDMLPDGLHPSAKGAELIAQEVWKALEPLVSASPPPQVFSAPTPGPVNLSIRNEARAAQQRAAQWMRTQETQPAPVAPALEEHIPTYFPLLVEPPTPSERMEIFAALAEVLAASGETTVFLPDEQPVAWRQALLRQMVSRQKISPQGGGYWSDATSDDIRATAFALQVITIALDE